jgi:hypothetical protein
MKSDECQDCIATMSGRMLLIDEHLDTLMSHLDGNMGSDFYELESTFRIFLETLNSLLEACDTCNLSKWDSFRIRDITLITMKILKYTTSLWKQQHYMIVILLTECSQSKTNGNDCWGDSPPTGFLIKNQSLLKTNNAFMWGVILWLGWVGNNLQFPFPLLRLNALLLEAVALNCYGWRSYCMIMDSLRIPWLSTVAIQVENNYWLLI